MAERDGTSRNSLRSFDRIVRGPQSGWPVRIEMMRASITGEIWCEQRSGLELFSPNAPIPSLA